MKKRGSVRTAFDGRYKFSRYFAPVEHNQPKSIDDLYKYNDVELFDLRNDPTEIRNLAADRVTNAKLIITMNDKLEAVIKTEIGRCENQSDLLQGRHLATSLGCHSSPLRECQPVEQADGYFHAIRLPDNADWH